MRKSLMLFAVLAFITAMSFADGARKPVFEFTIITEPGNYYLTRGIDGAIIINSDNVTLDLCGKTISWFLDFSGHTDIFIRNGTTGGIYADSSIPVRCRIENMNHTGGGIMLENVEFADIRDNYIYASGDSVNPASGIDLKSSVYGSSRITGNTIDATAYGIYLEGLNGSIISSNNILSYAGGHSGENGIYTDGSGSIICDNSVRDGGEYSSAIFSSQSAEGSLISGNTVLSGWDGTGMNIGSSGSLIINNNITSSLFYVSIYLSGACNVTRDNVLISLDVNVMRIDSDFNLIDSNKIYSMFGNEIGIFFNSNADSNSYRNNFFKGTSAPIQDDGTGNTDDGGNIN